MQWSVRIRLSKSERERERDVRRAAGSYSFLIESYVARLGTKIDYEAAGGSVPTFQASTGPVVVGEIWGKSGVCRFEECSSM